MSYSRSSRYKYLPLSQSQKMSIGMAVDAFDKPRVQSEDAKILTSRVEGEASGQQNAAKNTKQAFISFSTVSARGDHAQDGSDMIKTSQFCDNPPIKKDQNHTYKQVSASSPISYREKQTRHPSRLFPNQAVMQPVTGKKIETSGTVSRNQGEKDGVGEKAGEFPPGDNPDVSRPVKDMLHEQPDKMENRRRETLRMKLQEILGPVPAVDKKYDDSRMGEVVANEAVLVPAVDKKHDDSRMGEVVANEAVLVQTDKHDAQFKHKQSSDTIETDSEEADKTVSRPLTRLRIGKRLPANAKSKPADLKTKSSSRYKGEHRDAQFKHKQNSDTIETDSEEADKTVSRPLTRLRVRKRLPAKSKPADLKTKSLSRIKEEHRGSHPENLCHSMHEVFENVKQSCGMKPDGMINHTAEIEDKMLPPREQLSPRGRMTSPQQGCLHENLEPEAASHNKNISSPVAKEKHQQQNAEYPKSPKVPAHQVSLNSQSPLNHEDEINSPLLKMAKTVHSSNISHHLHSFVQAEGGKSVDQSKYRPATEEYTGSSSDEETYSTTSEPLTADRTQNGQMNPEGRESDSSEDPLSAKKVYPKDIHASPETGDIKRHMLFQTKLHCCNGAHHSSSCPSMQSPEVSANNDDELLEPLEEGPEDEFASVVSLLGLALERVKTKMMTLTNKRCSDILTSAAEEIHLQLYNVESQIQTDSEKLTSLGKLKRKHLEARLQEQQDRLKVIYEKFRKEIHEHIQDCKGTVEELEAQHAEQKGAMERQKVSQRKLLSQAEAVVDSQLNDAQRQIACIHKLGKQKMLKLRAAIADCLKGGISC